MNFTLEICANSIQSALAAEHGGAHRIELCDNMAEGGTTPSYGTISRCKNLLTIPVFPIIRPRGGDFLYTAEEFEVIKADILACRGLGCEGVVFGMLNADGGVDVDRCAELIALAKPMEATFHRAFDRCAHPLSALEEIIRLGFTRVLTSGGEITAYEGIPLLKKLNKQAQGRIILMAGAGVNIENISVIAAETGVNEFHTTAKISTGSGMHSRNEGKLAEEDKHKPLYETDEAMVKKIIHTLRGIFVHDANG